MAGHHPDELDIDAIAELLEQSADRSVAAIDSLRGDVSELRRLIDRDRDAWRARCDRVEAQVDRYGRHLAEALEELERIDRRCGALVIEDVDGHGDMRVRSARVGLDTKYVIGLVVTLVTAAIVPILIAILAAS